MIWRAASCSGSVTPERSASSIARADFVCTTPSATPPTAGPGPFRAALPHLIGDVLEPVQARLEADSDQPRSEREHRHDQVLPLFASTRSWGT